MAATTSSPELTQATASDAIERYFQASLFLLVVTGFVTLALTGRLDTFSLLAVACALLLRARQLVRNSGAKIPERLTSALGLLYVLVYAADFLLLSRNFVSATVHLLLFGMVMKLFSVQRDRDHTYLAILAFLEILSAAVLTVDTVFLASFTVFLLVAVSTFISMEMRRSARAGGTIQVAISEPAALTRAGKLRSFHGALMTFSAVIVVGIISLGTILFFMMPRLSGGYLSRLAQQSSLSTGFSDTVMLGEIGRIQQSSQVVMHIRLEDGAGAPEIRMRGVALSRFDGRQWFNPPHHSELMGHSSGRYDLTNGLGDYAPSLTQFATGKARRVVRYGVVMEPVGTNVVFLITTPKYIFGDFREVAIDFGQGLLNTDADRSTGKYAGLSDISQPSPDDLRSAPVGYADEISTRYLQLPYLDERVAELAHNITAGRTNAYDKASAIQDYLLRNFSYTLELPTIRPRDPIAYFLLERKKGHCEYFASAMAVLLRAEGIPSRIVTGFRGGEYNDITGEYIIRARDAHSWVEVYFPEHGWVTFDPTPPGAGPDVSRWSRLMLYADAAREFWREWVVNYDFSHQKALTDNAAVSGRERFDRLREWFRTRYESMLEWARSTHFRASQSPVRYALLSFAVLTVILSLIFAGSIYRAIAQRRLANDPRRAPSSAASLWYARLVRVLARRGFSKDPAQTPLEFASSISRRELQKPVRVFTRHYERARFGDSAEDAVKLPELYKEIVEKK